MDFNKARDAERQRFLQIGFALFAKQGANSTTVEEIARACGVTTEELLAVFGSREGFFTEMLRFRSKPPVKNKREAQREKRRQDILLAGLDLFIRRGYAATKVSDIAGAVGMSTGLLFHYFESKEKLYEELVRFGQLGPQSVMQVDRSDPLGFFQKAAEIIFGALRSSPVVAKVFILMSQAQHNEAAPDSVKAMLQSLHNISDSVPIIEEGQRRGVIREGDPEALSIAFWSAIQGVAEEFCLYDPPPDISPDWIVDILRKK